MSEENDEEKAQVLRVNVKKGATEEERRKAVKDAMFESVKARVVEEYEKLTGKPLEGSDEWTTREFENYSSLVAELKGQKDIKGIHEGQAPEGGDTASWGDNSEGINRSQKHFSNEREYNNTDDLIRDLRIQSHDTRDPVKAAEASAILNEMWKKWARQVKKDFEEHTSKSLVNYDSNKNEEERKKKIRQHQRGE